MNAFQFTPSWYMTCFFFVAMALFVRLGCWQLHRADEKRELIHADHLMSQQRPLSWSGHTPYPLPYQPVAVHGHFLETVFLWDNQYAQHQWGFDVLSPFVLDDGSVIIVDRGWVKGDRTRLSFPLITTSQQISSLKGRIYYPSQKTWVLGQDLEEKRQNLAVIERFDPHVMRKFLHKSVYPFIIRLDERDARGFVRQWPLVAMAPERHIAYAFQWFAIAGVILILYVVLNVKKKK